MLGIALALSTALGFAVAPLFARLALQHMRPTTLALISLVTGTILILILAFAFHTEEVLALGGVAFLWFLLSGVINFPLGRFFEYTSVNLTGVSRTATIIGAAPLFATIMAVTVGGETMNPLLIVGTIATVCGVLLILSQK